MDNVFRFLADKIINDETQCGQDNPDKAEDAKASLAWHTFEYMLEQAYCSSDDRLDDIKLGFEEILPTLPPEKFVQVLQRLGPGGLLRPDGRYTKLAHLLKENREYTEKVMFANYGDSLDGWMHECLMCLLKNEDKETVSE